MFFEPRHQARQTTFDDLEPVLETENKDRFNVKKPKRPRVKAALEAYEDRMSPDLGYDLPDPLA